ncbi:helix-turn-helix domain-containing protein [Caulobacter sp. UNC279MFTsu5.1]|uniref:AlbA family DNA-binding domain-containing protein n=1 Tax=Caulobacter sp. UNC279MFTsu5.1 TaxID=1502775 RepID=UPI0015A6FC03|nr:ATP-binding protein [Caulobacter sp. UNC279MFTsu5.1]
MRIAVKPLAEWTQADLEALIGTPESLTVDFKQSEAILIHGPAKEKVRASLVKDITALANAAGGRVYYGMREDKTTNVATELDDGVTMDDAKADVIADIITGNTEPQIVGLSVHEVRLNNGRYAFVINVPQAITLAPHQSRYDHVYYRRHDRKILKMYDHEIKDLMRRSDEPLITADILNVSNEGGVSFYQIRIENMSPALVKYFSVTLTLHDDLTFEEGSWPTWQYVGQAIEEDPDMRWAGKRYVYHFTPTSHQPLFKGQQHVLTTLVSKSGKTDFRQFSIRIAAHGFIGRWRGAVSVMPVYQQGVMHPWPEI